MERIRQGGIRAAGRHLVLATFQFARWRRVSETCRELGNDAVQPHRDQRTEAAGPAGSARVSAWIRYIREIARNGRGVSHQFRGCGNAVGDRGLHGEDQRALSDACTEGDLASTSLSTAPESVVTSLAGLPMLTVGRPQLHACLFQVSRDDFPENPGFKLNPPQRPSQSPECDNLPLLFLLVEDGG